MDKIEGLAKKLGVPVWRVKEALGIPLLESQAATFEQAECEVIISKKNREKDSEEERAALLRCIDLASNPYEGQTAHMHASGTALRKKAFDRWDDLSLQEVEEMKIEKIGGFNKMLRILNYLPENGRAEKRAIQRLNEACLSSGLARYICSLTRDRSPEEDLSFQNWDALSLKAVEAAENDLAKLKIATAGSPDGGRAQKEGIIRIYALLGHEES